MLEVKGLLPCNEQYEEYKDFQGRTLFQYDYRAEDGKLFTCVRECIAECIEAKNKWLSDIGKVR